MLTRYILTQEKTNCYIIATKVQSCMQIEKMHNMYYFYKFVLNAEQDAVCWSP